LNPTGSRHPRRISFWGFLGCVCDQIALATDKISCNRTLTTIGVHGTSRAMLQLSGMNTDVQTRWRSFYMEIR